MKNEKVFLPILLGTNRKDRQSENAAKWVFGKMQEREDIVTVHELGLAVTFSDLNFKCAEKI